MIGKYYRTLERDMATGETLFELAVLEPCSYAKNGLLLCKGKIGVYAHGIPLSIEGTYQSNYFYVHDYTVAFKTQAGMQAIIEYLSDNDLTEVQTNTIIEKCDNDISNLAKNPEILEVALKRSKQKDILKRKILKKLKSLHNQEKLTSILMQYGIELNKIEMMYAHDIDYEKFLSNPYLCSLFHTISIFQADQFAYEYKKILPYSPLRLCGFLMDALLVYKQSGHVCTTPKNVIDYMNMRMKKSIYPNCRISMSLLNYCVDLMKNYVGYHVVNNEVYLYENSIWEEEQMIINDLKRLNSSRIELVANPDIAKIEKTLGIVYNEKQRESFELLKTNGVKILTGPPGAGKTATLRGYIEAYKTQYPNREIRLAATTGRAAQVMKESTGKPAETINKMVDVRPFSTNAGKYQGKNPNNPISADFIICDEISMLGTQLASLLLHAVKSGTLLILVGDEDQLQSVEYGNILQDLIASKTIEVCRLTEVMRHSGTIVENAQRINNGKYTLLNDATFQIHKCSEEEALKTLYHNLQKENVQIITPVKKGTLGVYNVNRIMQKKRNLRKKLCLKYRNIEYYQGDPIIMTETNYDRGYYNGDIGTIQGCDEKGLLVDFGNKVMHIGKSDYHIMMLAYAITAHKSQGSGFEHIHILLPRQPDNMLTRRILYTAVTRAKKDVHIYEIEDAVTYAIQNKSERPRLSLLNTQLKLYEEKML